MSYLFELDGKYTMRIKLKRDRTAQLIRSMNPSGSPTPLSAAHLPTAPPISTRSTSAPASCMSKANKYGPSGPCSRDWYTCRNCHQVCWARMEPCLIVGHRSIFPFAEEELTVFCHQCSGPECENMTDLLVKFCPSSDLAARQRRVKVTERAREKREEWLSYASEPRERDSDPLGSARAKVDFSILYLLPLQKLAGQNREAWLCCPPLPRKMDPDPVMGTLAGVDLSDLSIVLSTKTMMFWAKI